MVDAGPIAILYAAAHPERVDSLVLCNTTARYLIADDYPIGFTPEALDLVIGFLRTSWVRRSSSRSLVQLARKIHPLRCPCAALPVVGHPENSGRTVRLHHLRNLDVRPVLPLLRAPTLVLSADNPSFLPMAHGRYVAEHIEGSKFVALPGADMLIRPADSIFDEVAEF